MDLVSLAMFAGLLAVTAGSPGPSIAALVSRVIARGPRNVMPFLAAFWIGEIIWLAAALAGLNALAETFHTGFLILRYAGLAYMVWLAIDMWRAPVSTEADAIPNHGSDLAMFGAGLALTLGNPKIMVFYLAILPTIFDVTALTLSHCALLAGITLVVIASTDLLWLGLAARARRFLKTPRAQKTVNRIGATTMFGAAGVIATRST